MVDPIHGQWSSGDIREMQRLLEAARPLGGFLQAYRQRIRRSLPAIEKLLEGWDSVDKNEGWNSLIAAKLFMKEDRHSDLLVSLLDPKAAHGLGDILFRGLLERAAVSEGMMRQIEAAEGRFVSRRERRGSVSRIDIEVEGPGFLVHIENKRPGGSETIVKGEPQTIREWSDVLRAAGRKGIPARHVAGVFLGPNGHTAQCKDFLPLSWLDLADLLRSFAVCGSVSDCVKYQLNQYADYLYNEVVGR